MSGTGVSTSAVLNTMVLLLNTVDVVVVHVVKMATIISVIVMVSSSTVIDVIPAPTTALASASAAIAASGGSVSLQLMTLCLRLHTRTIDNSRFSSAVLISLLLSTLDEIDSVVVEVSCVVSVGDFRRRHLAIVQHCCLSRVRVMMIYDYTCTKQVMIRHMSEPHVNSSARESSYSISTHAYIHAYMPTHLHFAFHSFRIDFFRANVFLDEGVADEFLKRLFLFGQVLCTRVSMFVRI